MNTLELEQGSDAWIAARCGSLGASRIADALATTKTGWGASRANLMAELIAERLTGQPAERFTNAAMAWGTDHEAEARMAYEFWAECDVVQVGLVLHPTIQGTHASPDGLVGDDGLVEIKCPNTATHLETLLSGSIPGKYAKQITWQLAVTGRQWCDFASYDPRLPDEMRLFTKRLHRDDKQIAEMEDAVRLFLAELDAKLSALRALYKIEEAA